MSITFEEAIEGSLRKWNEARSLRTWEEIEAWWRLEGRFRCPLCEYSKTHLSGSGELCWAVNGHCILCDINFVCCKEYQGCDMAFHKGDIAAFKRSASALYDRLGKLSR